MKDREIIRYSVTPYENAIGGDRLETFALARKKAERMSLAEGRKYYIHEVVEVINTVGDVIAE